MEHKDHKELWNKISDMQQHINLCEVERVRMQKDIEDLNQSKEKNSAWQMRLVGVFAAILMTLGGAGIKMYSTIQSQQVQIERLDWDVTKALDFVAKWPTGQLGVLPDDNVQNTKIEVLQEKVVELQGQINKLFNVIGFGSKVKTDG